MRATKYDSDGTPSEEVNDIVICLERNPTDAEKKNYEDVIGYYADGLYEATNGANFIGNVVVYTNGRNCSSADITWKKSGIWPGAGSGGIEVSDIWRNSKTNVDTPMMDSEKNRFDFGITLVHETMHYRYGIDDDYSKSTFTRPTLVPLTNGLTDYNCEITADPVSDKIIVKNKYIDHTRFKRIMKAYSEGMPVIFNAVDGGRFPKGLSDGPISNRKKMMEVVTWRKIMEIWWKTML